MRLTYRTSTQVLKSEIIHLCAGGRKIQETNVFFKIRPLSGILRENSPKIRQLSYLNGPFLTGILALRTFCDCLIVPSMDQGLSDCVYGCSDPDM